MQPRPALRAQNPEPGPYHRDHIPVVRDPLHPNPERHEGAQIHPKEERETNPSQEQEAQKAVVTSSLKSQPIFHQFSYFGVLNP